jgi:hypothetical protein
MEIGEPVRRIVIEPLEEPVPSEAPIPDERPVEAPEREPVPA